MYDDDEAMESMLEECMNDTDALREVVNELSFEIEYDDYADILMLLVDMHELKTDRLFGSTTLEKLYRQAKKIHSEVEERMEPVAERRLKEEREAGEEVRAGV